MTGMGPGQGEEMSREELTVEELIEHLRRLEPSATISLPGDLTFYKVDGDSECGYYIEVAEPLADLSPGFVKRNPGVKAAFISAPDYDDGQLVSGPVSVTVF